MNRDLIEVSHVINNRWQIKLLNDNNTYTAFGTSRKRHLIDKDVKLLRKLLLKASHLLTR